MRADLQDYLSEIWSGAVLRPMLITVTQDVDEATVLADRIVVMQPNPSRIADVQAVDMPRPRNRSAEGFDIARQSVMAALDRTLPRRI